MQRDVLQVYLSRHNLRTLLAKLDAGLIGEVTLRTIVKPSTSHPKYPCTVTTIVTALEDHEIHLGEDAVLESSGS